MGVRSDRNVRRASGPKSGRRVQLPVTARRRKDLCVATRAIFLFRTRTSHAVVQTILSIWVLADPSHRETSKAHDGPADGAAVVLSRVHCFRNSGVVVA